MPRYFVNDPNSVEFVHLKTARVKSITSEPTYQLELCLMLRRSIPILERESTTGNILTRGSTGDLALLELTCSIDFVLRESGRVKTVVFRPYDDSRLYISGNTFFCVPITKIDIENFNSWRNGETIQLILSIRGFAAPVDSLLPYPIIWTDMSNRNQSLLPSLDSAQFYSQIMNPIGLRDNFVEEFPIEMPDLIRTAKGLPSGIATFLTDLSIMQEHLSTAVRLLRESRTTEDFRHVMDEVKTALDSMRQFKDVRALSKEIIIHTGIIGNVDTSMGGDSSADEYLTYFFTAMENIYQMASKPAHTKLRGKGVQPRFSMTPDRTDAVFVLVTALAAYKFLVNRIRMHINTVQ